MGLETVQIVLETQVCCLFVWKVKSQRRPWAVVPSLFLLSYIQSKTVV